MMNVLVAALEISLGAGALRPTADTSYDHRYVARVEFDTTAPGTAGHTLRLEGKSGAVFHLGVGLDLGRTIALELLARRTAYDLGGTSSPHSVDMRYTAFQPPSFEAQVFERRYSEPWADPEGRVHQSVAALNLRLHTPAGPPVSFGLSAGPALYRVSGRLQSLAYTTFFLGGHSVLFSETYQLAVDLPARWTLGLDVGGEAALRLGAHAAIVIDARYFWAGGTEVVPRIAAIVNADQVIRQLSVPDAQAQVPLAPLSMRSSFATGAVLLRFKP